MKLFLFFIILGLALMITGGVIGLPSDDVTTILQGAMLCWLALPCFWMASKVQPK